MPFRLLMQDEVGIMLGVAVAVAVDFHPAGISHCNFVHHDSFQCLPWYVRQNACDYHAKREVHSLTHAHFSVVAHLFIFGSTGTCIQENA